MKILEVLSSEIHGHYSMDKALPKVNRVERGGVQKMRIRETANFEEMLETEIEKRNFIFDALDSLNKQQLEVSENAEKVITDPDSVEAHDVTISMAKAQMSLSLAQNVVSRICGVWKEMSISL